jgi:tetratricopeptide (TPR) repeat protein
MADNNNKKQKAFFMLLQGLVIFVASANPQNTALPKKTPTTLSLPVIAEICLTSPFACLQQVDDALHSAPQNSRIYFEILQYKMEALFNLQKVDELYQETKKWLDKPNLPLPFQVTNAIYFAKMAWYIGEKEAAKESYFVAKSLLAQMNEEYPSPLRLVQFANLQLQLEEYQDAYDLLLGLAKKYPNSPDTRFMVELHGNLGHTANRLGNYKNALRHWQETKKWVYLFGNKQQIAVVLFNLAEIQLKLMQHEQAEKSFIAAISYAVEAGDHVKANQARFLLLETQLKLRKVCTKSTMLNALDTKYLPDKEKYNVARLTAKLSSC